MKSLTKDFFKTTLITSLAFIFAIGLSVVNARERGQPPLIPKKYGVIFLYFQPNFLGNSSFW